MKINMGSADRMIRGVAAVVLLIAGIALGPGGVLAIVLYALAGLMGVTAAAGNCPAYSVVGLSTCPAKQQQGA